MKIIGIFEAGKHESETSNPHKEKEFYFRIWIPRLWAFIGISVGYRKMPK